MITLKDSLKLKPSQIQDLKQEILESAKNSQLNAYIGDIKPSTDSGIPILIKDNINVKGWEITCASKILKGYLSPYNADVIDRLHANGFCGFGRANMDEFAMGSTTENSCYGATKNPRDLSRVAGGSSGGSAAAVAGGIAIAALGSDTGGSIRQPAAYCGCVGLKPTYGGVSRYGLIAYSSSLDQIGPITQNVEDCAILFDTIKGNDKKDSTSSIIHQKPCFPSLNPKRKMRIAILKDLIEKASDPIKKVYFDSLTFLEKMGHTIVEKTMLQMEYHISTYYIICTAEASSNLARFDGIRYGNRAKNPTNLKDLYQQTRTNGFGKEVQNRILLGSFVLSSGYYDAYYLKAQKIREIIKQQYYDIFLDCDVIFSPVSPIIAPKFDSTKNPLEMYLSDIYTIGTNLAGIPAISLPMGSNEANLPIGMQFIAKAFNEQSLLDIAYGVEQTLNLKF